MKILLIKPLYSFKSYHTIQFTASEKALPLSLAYIAAILEKEGHDIRILDYQIEKKNIQDELRDYNPDVIGMTVFSKEFDHALEIMSKIKNIKNIPIILGGAHINEYQEKIYESTDLPDFLVIREGEETIKELIQCIEKKGNFDEVKGIVYRDMGKKIIKTGKRELISDINNLPFMALNYFKIDKYYPQAGTFRRLPSVTMISSRGCPYNCIFCNTSLFGKSIRLRTAENVLEEVELIVNKYGAKEINFCDETFTINRERVIRICQGFIDKKINIAWKCSTRVDKVDFELLKLMKKSGCFCISFGVESGVQKILDFLCKGIRLEDIRKAFRETRKAGILSAAFFMINIPGETIQDIEQTIKFSREIKPDFVNFELIKPYNGTKMRKIIEENPGIEINYDIWDKWSEYSTGNRLYYTQKGISASYLYDAYKRANKDFYLNLKFIIKAIFQIRSFEQFKSYYRAFFNMIKVKMIFQKST